jgi:polyhydroxybutyrate depolymerase
LVLHGAKDRIVPYEGVRYSRDLRTALTPVPQAAATIAARSGCRGHVDATTGALHTVRYTGCAAGTAVEIQAFSALGHAWPTQTENRIEGARIDWDFLRQHERVG